MPRVSLLSLLAIAGAVAAVGCGGPSGSTPAPRPAATSGTNGGGGAGGAGGEGAGGGGTGGVAFTTSTPADWEKPWSCAEDLGYWATKTAFSHPTPQPLAAALNELSYGVESRPISLVLRDETGTLTGALSATTAGLSGSEVFPGEKAPIFAPLIPADGQGVTTKDAQPKAFLRFVDLDGPVEVEIEHVVWRASEYFSCNLLWVDVEAVLSTAEYDTVFHLGEGERTIEELVGEGPGAGAPGQDPMVDSPDGGAPDGGAVGAQIHFSFQGTPMAFDFGSL